MVCGCHAYRGVSIWLVYKVKVYTISLGSPDNTVTKHSCPLSSLKDSNAFSSHGNASTQMH